MCVEPVVIERADGMGEYAWLETRAGHPGVGTIRIDRPPFNPLSRQVQIEIAAAAREASTRDDIKAVVIYGGPRTLAAGADIKEMHGMSSTDLRDDSRRLQDDLGSIAGVEKPTIVAITGHAVGGGLELSLGADRRVAASDAKLGLPETRVGIMPGGGGTQRLTRLVGVTNAKELILTGRIIGADEALRIGLVDEVVPADNVYERALSWAGQFERAASIAVAKSKRAIDRGLDVGLAEGLEIERRLFVDVFDTADRAHGFQSFIDDGPGRTEYEGR